MHVIASFQNHWTDEVVRNADDQTDDDHKNRLSRFTLGVKIDEALIFVLAITPIIGLFGTAVYTVYFGFHWWMSALFLAMYVLVGISICAGYHRYFSHKSYGCHTVVQYFYAIFGAMAFQNSILQWASKHRSHHTHVDSDWDPYNIQRGFWWAHIAWIFYSTPHQPARDLSANRVVRWQERWHTAIGCVGAFGTWLRASSFSLVSFFRLDAGFTSRRIF